MLVNVLHELIFKTVNYPDIQRCNYIYNFWVFNPLLLWSQSRLGQVSKERTLGVKQSIFSHATCLAVTKPYIKQKQNQTPQ